MSRVTWRVGRTVGRTIYHQHGSEPSDLDHLIGVMDTPELARRAVDAVNRVQGESTALIQAAKTVLEAYQYLLDADDGLDVMRDALTELKEALP